jgi:16S rRNA (uracil1498-N3)-methyltransferase
VQSDERPGGSDIPAGLEYFYVPPGAVSGERAIIEGEEFSHLTHVMRHHEGDVIGIVDGAGMAYVTLISDVRQRAAHCTILSTHPRLHEPSRHVTLAVGILKNPSRFDIVVEKVTELGVTTIIPMLTARTISRHAKASRWQMIALAAMKQCGRCVLPEVRPLTALQDVLSSARGARLLFHELATEPIEAASLGGMTDACTVCVGPEGGFTEEEVNSARALGWKVVSLGTRRLRSETAAITAAVRLTS